MSTSVRSDYFFIRALPTEMWSKILRYCQSHTSGDGQLSMYEFDAQTRLTIDVKPSNSYLSESSDLLLGTFFSERFHQHTFGDIVKAVREGSLDPKALTYPELLSGQDTMVVFFWPDEGMAAQQGIEIDAYVHRKSDRLFAELEACAMR